MIDLRSDTLTKPTREMRAAMAAAEVGDDCNREDPTVAKLEERIAAMLDKEAALFVPSGTMSNQIGIRLHCSPGDEFICEANCHIYNFEQGAFAQLSGLAARPVEGEFGVLRPDQLVDAIRPEGDLFSRTKLVCLEITHNRGAGRIQPYESVECICRWAHEKGLSTHLDGARLFNAVVATGIAAPNWAVNFDTVSCCFSKGLGAPVGSALCGSKSAIQQARRHRRALGGSMRQAGVVAAAALVALDHHVDRLAVDHAHARLLADAIAECEALELWPKTVETNIVIFRIEPSWGTAKEFAAAARERGVLMLAIAPQAVRAVTHLDVSRADIERTANVVQKISTCRQGTSSSGGH
ncbi:MAG: low specificity L-threonine aldolase [Pirellulales bacterium]|nr:low specificity L-threonine aldolase [Pirellulales bacterium]